MNEMTDKTIANAIKRINESFESPRELPYVIIGNVPMPYNPKRPIGPKYWEGEK